jgi:hypothetical protein
MAAVGLAGGRVTVYEGGPDDISATFGGLGGSSASSFIAEQPRGVNGLQLGPEPEIANEAMIRRNRAMRGTWLDAERAGEGAADDGMDGTALNGRALVRGE